MVFFVCVFVLFCFVLCLEGILGSASGDEFPVSLRNHVGFTPRLLYSSTHQKVLPILVELKMLDFSDCTRTGISILVSAADCLYHIPILENE